MMSNSIINSILEINLYILITSTLVLFIKSKLSFKWQRFSILSIPVISLAIWALKPFLVANQLVYNTALLDPIIIGTETISEPLISSFQWNWSLGYAFISVLVFVYFLYKMSRVFWFFRDAVPQGAVSIKTTSDEDSFSFFKFIHLRSEMGEQEKQVVLQHELIHHQKNHSLDLVIMELIHSLFWINPVFFFLKKELVNIHEFEVDQEMYKSYKTNYMRHLLNYALGSVDSHYLLTSPFFNRLTITKRIETMKTNRNNNNIWLFLSIPLLALGLSVISCEQESLESGSSPEVLGTNKKTGETVYAPEAFDKPQYPGGQHEMYKFLGENMKYPKQSEAESVEGRVIVKFTVNETGAIEEAVVVKGVNDEMDAEALRVVNSMPDWIPAEKDGKPVKSTMHLPFMFKLE